MPASGAAATVCRISAGYQLREASGIRIPNIEEVKLLASFPAGFVLIGGIAERWARLGNSVPPLLARALAAEIRRFMDAS